MNASLALPLDAWTPWRRGLVALGLVATTILALFARDASAMAGIWWDSSTFGHCLFVPPIIAGLVWQRMPGLRRLTPGAWAPALAWLLLGALAWLLGDAAGVALARHLGLVLMLQGAVAAVLGRTVTRALLFPLGYAFFLVPAGEELVPPLQTLTAKLAIGLLHLTRVPAAIDGVFITTPGGYFEVAEACSGIQFLVAMVAFGVLAANQCFASWRRRALFLAIAVAVPVLANGVRAWATIYISWFTNTNFAGSFDHIVFGWIFFGVVMAIVMGASWRFFDRAPDAPFFDPAALQPVAPAADPNATWIVALLALACAWSPVAWAHAARAEPAAITRVALPSVPGWAPVRARPSVPWRPHFAGADALAVGHYRDAAGHAVDLAIAVYADQAEGRELVGYGQGAIDPASKWAWTADSPAPPGGRGERISAPGPVVREVVSFYRVGHVLTGSPHLVKLETLKTRLLGGSPAAVAVLVSAEGPQARASVDAFLGALGPVDALADRATLR